MMTLITGVIGIAGVAAFLGLMLWWVPALPLIIIVGEVGLLLIYDFGRTLIYGESADPVLAGTARTGVPLLYGACNIAFGLLLVWLFNRGALATAGGEYVLLAGVILLGAGTFLYGLWNLISGRERSFGNRRN